MLSIVANGHPSGSILYSITPHANSGTSCKIGTSGRRIVRNNLVKTQFHARPAEKEIAIGTARSNGTDT